MFQKHAELNITRGVQQIGGGLNVQGDTVTTRILRDVTAPRGRQVRRIERVNRGVRRNPAADVLNTSTTGGNIGGGTINQRPTGG